MSDPSQPTAADLTQLLERTFDQSTRVIERVTTDEWALPTPCASFDAATLAGHMLFAAERVRAAGARLPIPESDTAVSGVGPAEIASAFDKTATEALTAWKSPGAFDGEIALPFGTFPAAVVAEIYVIEQATHAWDLAVALGARQMLDESLAASVLPIARVAIQPEYRGDEPMPFGSEVASDAVLAPYDRLAAFMGRTPMTTGERADLVASLRSHRAFLLQTVKGITDEQASLRTTVSELSLGGLIKHVTAVEEGWANFIVRGARSMEPSESAYEAHAEGFRFDAGDSLASVLDRYEEVARRTDELIAELPSLEVSHPLPARPWFPPGASWSARYVVLHILAETSQHAGHADIIREALDGSKTMG